jgi:phosphoglycerate dehydrogenase-like enzyme
MGGVMWKEEPSELTGINCGVVGLGASGSLVARALRFFGAHVYYFSRTRKPDLEEKEGYVYLPLDQLLGKTEILCACLNKNVILFGEREFSLFGNGKIWMNTNIGPAHEPAALRNWLKYPRNYAFSDTSAGLGDETLTALPNVFCGVRSAGLTSLAKQRLGQKVIANIEQFLS